MLLQQLQMPLSTQALDIFTALNNGNNVIEYT